MRRLQFFKNYTIKILKYRSKFAIVDIEFFCILILFNFIRDTFTVNCYRQYKESLYDKNNVAD